MPESKVRLGGGCVYTTVLVFSSGHGSHGHGHGALTVRDGSFRLSIADVCWKDKYPASIRFG